MLSPVRVKWFPNQKGIVGIAMCKDEDGKVVYRISVVDGLHEPIDVNMVASWGANFPEKAGKALFKETK